MIQRFRRRGRRTCGESIDTESLSIRHIRCRIGTGRSLVRLRPVKREAERYRISLLRAGFPGSLFRTSCQSRAPSKQRQHPIQVSVFYSSFLVLVHHRVHRVTRSGSFSTKSRYSCSGSHRSSSPLSVPSSGYLPFCPP